MPIAANGDTGGDEGFKRVLTLIGTAAGDEKHDPSAHSILDIVWVLYDKILRFDPLAPLTAGLSRRCRGVVNPDSSARGQGVASSPR